MPFDVIESELHRLPDARARGDRARGEMHPGETAPEGPFGEFTGYYAGGQSEQPVIRVQRVYHRNEPILTMADADAPAFGFLLQQVRHEGGDDLGRGRARRPLRGEGVWCHEAGGARMFNVIAIKQAYAATPSRRPWPRRAASRAPISALRRGRRRGHRPDQPVRSALGDVHALRPGEDIDIVRKMWSGPWTRASRAAPPGIRAR